MKPVAKSMVAFPVSRTARLSQMVKYEFFVHQIKLSVGLHGSTSIVVTTLPPKGLYLQICLLCNGPLWSDLNAKKNKDP